MLLIGDIHITTKYTDQIIDSLRRYVGQFPHEKHIIFMGDYMYMFSYDRRALARLFDLFLDFRQQGKNVYILAGNHDWIGQQFVYAEGKKIADMLPSHETHTIQFITHPELHTIEGKEILFFPFSKHFSPSHPHIDNLLTDNETIKNLLNSKNNNERLSGEINLILEDYIKKHKQLTIIHHYYVANTRFPGQQAIFDYRDIALCPDILNYDHIQLISGHIHMPFAYKNYLCVGSIWYTSPLEQDHHKFLFQRDTENDTSNDIKATQIAINPYIVLPMSEGQQITQISIENHKKEIDKKIAATFGGTRNVSLSLSDYTLADTHITLLTDSVAYHDLQSQVDPSLFPLVKEWAIKKKTNNSRDLSFTLEVAQKNLQESLIDRKIIVKDFVMSRFGEDFDKYRTLLDELHILS